MNKRGLSIFFISLVLFSVFASMIVMGQESVSPTRYGCDGAGVTAWYCDIFPRPITNNLDTLMSAWNGNFEDGAFGAVTKLFALILIIVLIYSALGFANFPESGVARFIISVIVGFFATVLISSAELYAALQSYTAMGLALIIFFPIMILIFFTMVISSKGSPFGIYLQKILWIIYAVYLFIKTASILVLRYYATLSGGGVNPSESPILSFFLGEDVVADLAVTGDNTTLLVLLIVSIAVFVITIGNKFFVAWAAKEKLDAELQAQRTMQERSHIYDKTRSDSIQRT